MGGIMYQFNEFEQRELLDSALAEQVANLLSAAVKIKGKASLAVSGGSTPKGFFSSLIEEKNCLACHYYHFSR